MSPGLRRVVELLATAFLAISIGISFPAAVPGTHVIGDVDYHKLDALPPTCKNDGHDHYPCLLD